MATKDAYGLIIMGCIKEDQTDFQNAKALGITFDSASWDVGFIIKCAVEGKSFLYMDLVTDFLCGAKLGAHGIMSRSRAQFLSGLAFGLWSVKHSEIKLGKKIK